jgi:hypothetical protein
MTSLLDTSAIDARASEVLAALRPESVVVVGGPEGAGRGHVLERVREARRVVELEGAPLWDPDAAVHLLLQLLAFVPFAERSVILASGDLRQSAFRATQRAAEERNADVLALRLPRSWERLLETRSDDEDEPQLDRARDVIRGLQDHAGVAVLVLCGSARREWRRYLRSPVFLALDASRAVLAPLDDDSMWEGYSAHARDVAKTCVRSGASVSPLQTRLLVGLKALGASDHDAISSLSKAPPGALWPLLRVLKARLASDEHLPLRVAVHQVLAARRPVPASMLEVLTDLPEHQAFFRQCIGYETSLGVRVPEVVRDALRVASEEPLEQTHERLHAHFKSLDGKADPCEVDGIDEMRAWLERAHHAAHIADDGPWNELEPPYAEFYWARARWLSRVRKSYAAAADVYSAGVERFPADDYGWHYLAWNAERDGRPSAIVEPAYREAIAQNPTNRWWNSRLVTFLISRAQYDRAEAEYADGLARLQSAGTEAGLARAFHLWIVRAWLDAGELTRARAVFDDIPETALAEPLIANLQRRLLDAEEAEALGTSIYPAAHTLGERWKRPGLLPAEVDGKRLTHWYPAYVLEVGDAVSIAFATPSPEPERRVLRRELSLGAWGAATEERAIAGTWVFVGRYEGDVTRIKLNPATFDLPEWERDTVAEISAYLRAWKTGDATDPREEPLPTSLPTES